ncbi:TetR/AcrR family transcriptional regulator [Rhizorhapis suberifaciens]|uniref:AcrR family transcriptional regulator n=1 Tax=Rhizorhapis suberifaciens TaxID=13656 RepID=A0A840HQQ9_9SPHN|nr:TetR/AcrR family transcriptional regulator [Rhizorhapis suberifaciens]MBB4639938.1 AcrR family transcriptional regulator [Rhizorhapis suberifaciens]
MTNQTSKTGIQQRGPAEHAIRDQIVQAAHEHFAHYGYGKTTVADLAREIGFSKAYIYRFFDSKQAIGEAICADCLTQLLAKVREAVDKADSATEKFRQFAKTVTNSGVELFFTDRKIYEIAALASSEKWSSAQAYTISLQALLATILKAGRESGEFERKTPLDETCRAIFYALLPFIDPLSLERNLNLLPDAPSEVAGLVLRSLAP